MPRRTEEARATDEYQPEQLVHAHSHIPLQHRLVAWLPASRGSRWVVGGIGPAAGLVGSALAVLALTLVLLALAAGGVGGDPATTAPPPGAIGGPVTLPGGIAAVAEGGIVHAPHSYAPPGIWTPKSGPGPVGG